MKIISDGITQVVSADSLRVGDWISEIDTPTGPWYQVVAVSPASVTIDGRTSHDEPPLPVTVETRPLALVLCRRASAG